MPLQNESKKEKLSMDSHIFLVYYCFHFFLLLLLPRNTIKSVKSQLKNGKASAIHKRYSNLFIWMIRELGGFCVFFFFFLTPQTDFSKFKLIGFCTLPFMWRLSKKKERERERKKKVNTCIYIKRACMPEYHSEFKQNWELLHQGTYLLKQKVSSV